MQLCRIRIRIRIRIISHLRFAKAPFLYLLSDGFNDFLLWLDQMKTEAKASSITLLRFGKDILQGPTTSKTSSISIVATIIIIIIIIASWSTVDHDHLIKNLVANGEGLKERLLEV